METLRALQIFEEDLHPSNIKNSGRSKEGFSLYGLMSTTKTP